MFTLAPGPPTAAETHHATSAARAAKQTVQRTSAGEQKFQKVPSGPRTVKDDPDPYLFTDETTQLSSHLCTFYLKGKRLNLVWFCIGQRNGLHVFLPNTQQKGLTLARALVAYLRFSSSKRVNREHPSI